MTEPSGDKLSLEEAYKEAERRAHAGKPGRAGLQRFAAFVGAVVVCGVAAFVGVFAAGALGTSWLGRRLTATADNVIGIVSSGDGPYILLGIGVAIAIGFVFRLTRL